MVGEVRRAEVVEGVEIEVDAAVGDGAVEDVVGGACRGGIYDGWGRAEDGGEEGLELAWGRSR